jgi:hypothetical protein
MSAKSVKDVDEWSEFNRNTLTAMSVLQSLNMAWISARRKEMSIVLSIEISEHSARILRSWASVAHSLDNVSSTLRDVLTDLPDTETVEERVGESLDNLEYLKPSISELCYQVRQALIEKKVKALWEK